MKTVLLLAALSLSTGLCAQDLAAPAAASAVPNPAPVDPARLALAHEVVVAMRADRMFAPLVGQMKQAAQDAAALPANATPVQIKRAQVLTRTLVSLTVDATDGLVAQLDSVYAETFSEAELKAMKSFYGSPEGQSMLAKQPAVLGHLRPLVAAMQHDLAPKFQSLIKAYQESFAQDNAARTDAEAAAKPDETKPAQ